MKRSTTSPPPHETGKGQPASLADAFANIGKYWREFRTYLAFYVGVQIDRLLLSIKMMILCGALAGLVLIGLAAMLVTAAVQICVGIAQLISDALGGRQWAGNLITGGIIWIVVLAVAITAVSILIRKSRKATVEKYEQRRAEQRATVGHDAGQRADV